MCTRTILSVLAAAVLAQNAAAAGTRKEKLPEKPRLIEVVFPGPGPLLMFDKDIGSGRAAINFRGMKMHYLAVGDRIQEGHLLVPLDSLCEWQIKRGALAVAQADHTGRVALYQEAEKRIEKAEGPRARRGTDPSELAAAEQTREFYLKCTGTSRNAANIAESDFQRAQLRMDSDRIRSPIKGVVLTIQTRGEAQSRETVVVLRIDE